MEGGGGKSAGARVSSPTAASSASTEGERVGAMCPICFEPLSCNGMHRICCLPCGHVYGRSCLERSYDASGDKSDKCLTCNEVFHPAHIINLYAPGSNVDGCPRSQELKEVKSQMKTRIEFTMTRQVDFEEELIKQLKAELSEELKQAVKELQSELIQMVRVRTEELPQGYAERAFTVKLNKYISDLQSRKHLV